MNNNKLVLAIGSVFVFILIIAFSFFLFRAKTEPVTFKKIDGELPLNSSALESSEWALVPDVQSLERIFGDKYGFPMNSPIFSEPKKGEDPIYAKLIVPMDTEGVVPVVFYRYDKKLKRWSEIAEEKIPKDIKDYFSKN